MFFFFAFVVLVAAVTAVVAAAVVAMGVAVVVVVVHLTSLSEEVLQFAVYLIFLLKIVTDIKSSIFFHLIQI